MRRAERNRTFEMTRRNVLRSALAIGAAGLASRLGMPAIAAAAAAKQSKRRFLFCYFPGGWDQLLFLDPRDPTANAKRYDDSNRSATLTETRYDALEGHNGFTPNLIRAGNLLLGPAAEKPGLDVPRLSTYHARIAIVRGLNMGTLGHEVGYRYFLTGKFPSGNVARGTSVATECAGQMQSAAPLPALSLRVESYNDRQPGQYSAMRVDSLDDLLLVLERGKEYVEKDALEDALADYAKSRSGCAVEVYDRRGLLSRMRDADAATRTTLASHLASRFRFVTSDDAASAEIRARYGFNKGDAGSPGARAAFAAQAIKQGVAQCVSVMIGNGTDTHFVGNTNHADALYGGIAALAALIDDLGRSEAPRDLQEIGGKTWLDHTTILAFSEFARTPLFNQFGGRDHHLCSSCLLAGAGIAGDQIVGASGEVGMGPGRYDFKARRAVTEGGENITPEHIAATLLASAGLDPAAALLRSEPLTALIRA
jgi:hypothetical protein